jgi:hypothetical protein
MKVSFVLVEVVELDYVGVRRKKVEGLGFC